MYIDGMFAFIFVSSEIWLSPFVSNAVPAVPVDTNTASSIMTGTDLQWTPRILSRLILCVCDIFSRNLLSLASGCQSASNERSEAHKDASWRYWIRSSDRSDLSDIEKDLHLSQSGSKNRSQKLKKGGSNQILQVGLRWFFRTDSARCRRHHPHNRTYEDPVVRDTSVAACCTSVQLIPTLCCLFSRWPQHKLRGECTIHNTEYWILSSLSYPLYLSDSPTTLKLHRVTTAEFPCPRIPMEFSNFLNDRLIALFCRSSSQFPLSWAKILTAREKVAVKYWGW